MTHLNKVELLKLLRAHTSEAKTFVLVSNSQLYDCFWWDGVAWKRDRGDKIEGGETSVISEADVFDLLAEYLKVQNEVDLLERFSADPWTQFWTKA